MMLKNKKNIKQNSDIEDSPMNLEKDKESATEEKLVEQAIKEPDLSSRLRHRVPS